MASKKQIGLLILTFIFAAGYVLAQGENVLRLVPYAESQQYLVEQIRADTTENGGIPEGRVYELDGGAVYLNTEQFYLEAEYTLHLRSSNDQKAIIYQYPSGTGDNPQEPPGYLFRSRGGDMIFEGLAVAGYFEPGDDPDAGNFDYFYNVQGGLLRTDGEGASLWMKDCIFSNIAGQILRTNASTHKIHVEDCIFANLGALSTSNFGAGKGLDLRESSCDSLIMVNNTFVNYQDRVIRHYNFGDPLAGTGDLTYADINHNTFVNGMGFHGLLSLGNVGEKIEITNNLYIDAFSAGEDSTDETRTAEWANTGEQYANGNNRMAWIFAAPNESTEWVVDNNLYAVSTEGQAFFDTYDEIDVGNPLSIYIRDALGADADNAFNMIDDPGLTNVPDLMVGLMTYYVVDAEKTKDTPNDTWDPETQDMDRRPITYYVSDFDASFPTSSEAYTAAEGGFPVGDLNWFPDKKTEWEDYITSVEIDYSDAVVKDYALEQNYPNPFNPSTIIEYSIVEASNVTLKVYNSLGEEVITLVNKDQAPGRYTVTWNGKDTFNNSLTSGVYIYTLNVSGKSFARKMILMK